MMRIQLTQWTPDRNGPARVWARILACMGAGLVIALACGCMRERVTQDGWGWVRDSEWADSRKTKASIRNADTSHSQGGWAIQIAAFEGRNRQREARQLAKLAQLHSRIADIWLEEVPASKDAKTLGKVRVLAGHYRSNDDWGAMEDLNHLRLVAVEGDYPFVGSELIPLGNALTGGDSEYDLKRYVGMFTLQIGFFDSAAGEEFRKLAEQAVKDLRTKGEQAYFYHGPHRSLICLGLFTENDFTEEGGTRTYGPRIRELQSKHPYNLANGYTMIEKQQGQVLGEQPSFLVRVF